MTALNHRHQQQQQQLSLPGFDAALALAFNPEHPGADDGVIDCRRQGAARWYTLLLALFPRPEDARRIARTIAGLRGRHGLSGAALRPERLHITLHALATFSSGSSPIPQAVIDAAFAAAATVTRPCMLIVFDRALTFPESKAFVLRCDADSDAVVAGLRGTLALALRRHGHRPKPSSTPHMTMLYDTHCVTEHPIEPLRWTASHFALILSHVGIHHHQRIGQWALGEDGS